MPTHRAALPLLGPRSTQRGAATLLVTLALLFAMLLVAGYVNRNLVFEQRAAANQARATQAFEAAEAGLEWAQAQLNEPGRIGNDCRPSSDAAATSFRERYLSYRPADAGFDAATWLQGGVPRPRLAACVRGASGWQCDCPSTAAPALVAPPGAAAAFLVRFEAGGAPGVVRVLATGCSQLGGECAPGAAAASDATAHVEAALGLVPGLKTAPAAALTVKGSVDAGSAAIGLHHGDVATGGIALHAGGAVQVPQARIAGPAGSVADDAVVADDAALAGLDARSFFASYFGMGLLERAGQSVVTPLRCEGDCGTALSGAVGAGIEHALIQVEGDLQLDGPRVLGTPQRPVAIVVDGAVQLRGAVVIHGLLYSRSLRWDDTAATGALLHGAAVVEGNYAGNGSPDFAHDAAILARLQGNTGSFARINGSWRDF